VKNARTKLINDGTITSDLAPSYFVECLLYNVPDDRFVNSYNQTFSNILWYLYESDISTFVCQNEQTKLFGDTPEQWNTNDGKRFIQALITLWNDW
jgi:hypothetical protein